MTDPLPIVLGVLLVVLGAAGATMTQRHFEEAGRATVAPLLLAPFGVLIGAGAAFARGWSLAPSIVVGAVAIPAVGAASRWWEVRRGRRR